MTQASTATATTSKWGGGQSPYNVSYGKIMMWFFLLSDALTFGALLISYGTTRFASNVWPDPNEVFHSFPVLSDLLHKPMPLMFVSLMTFILILSSVTMVLAVHAGHYNDKKGVIRWMLLTIIGGICFLACQAWEWTHLYHTGAWWGSFIDAPLDSVKHLFNMHKPGTAEAIAANPSVAANATHDFYNYFFTITGFHGAHVTSGVILNIMLLINTVNGTYERRGHYEMVEKVGLYWHFVDLVWVFVFTCFYLL
ncbi:cytochrome c oxidase subunit 3 [Taibaiella chishuiensis]|uniref:Cytochrome c oxidase subunit 3 n=1 Tax=Taibaiella chishuiensis TaxID=1434707 RepID=A0A2P8DBU0_9BACT|nr:cytochrome c oxidase subunit 3 [Taibaiella chishuiensis]PSK94664.1 cytochrome c oxidase subunit 3 [Taibaiella chishuiensis]